MIPECMAESVAAARHLFMDWADPEARFSSVSRLLSQSSDVVDTPAAMLEPEPVRQTNDSGRRYSHTIPQVRVVVRPRNEYPPTREKAIFDNRSCKQCGKLYEPTGAGSKVCGRECWLAMRRDQNHKRRARQVMSLTKQEKKAMRESCQHPNWYSNGAGMKMCKACGAVRKKEAA